MWRIEEHRDVDKELSSRRVPLEILKRYEKWKDIAALSGPQGLRAIKGFRDEALSGEWKGFRSSRLNEQWRVMYQVVTEALLVRECESLHMTIGDREYA
jgi:addiction module RelE/StbE family toxin